MGRVKYPARRVGNPPYPEMLSRIVQLSLRHRGVVLALSVLLLAWCAFVASRAPLDVFPEFVQPQVTVQTEAPGLAPEQVETLVTRPIESAVNGAAELDSVRSESIQGLSVVTVGPGAFAASTTLIVEALTVLDPVTERLNMWVTALEVALAGRATFLVTVPEVQGTVAGRPVSAGVDENMQLVALVT